jgi:hypothetical protein
MKTNALKISTPLFLFNLFCINITLADSRTLSVDSPRNGGASSAEITVDANESAVIEVINYSVEHNSYVGKAYLQVDTGSGYVSILTNSNVLPSDKITIEGPCKFKLHVNNHSQSNYYYRMYMKCLYRIVLKAGLSDNSKKFATVIPENSSGNVDIILEQSTDLINWTAVNPGSFPPSTAKRFFRVRSQE